METYGLGEAFMHGDANKCCMRYETHRAAHSGGAYNRIVSRMAELLKEEVGALDEVHWQAIRDTLKKNLPCCPKARCGKAWDSYSCPTGG
jgi:hypothetical protein